MNDASIIGMSMGKLTQTILGPQAYFINLELLTGERVWLRTLTVAPLLYDAICLPSCTVDGALLAIAVAARDEDSSEYINHFYVLDREIRTILHDFTPWYPLPAGGLRAPMRPAWSPDGRTVAYHRGYLSPMWEPRCIINWENPEGHIVKGWAFHSSNLVVGYTIYDGQNGGLAVFKDARAGDILGRIKGFRFSQFLFGHQGCQAILSPMTMPKQHQEDLPAVVRNATDAVIWDVHACVMLREIGLQSNVPCTHVLLSNRVVVDLPPKDGKGQCLQFFDMEIGDVVVGVEHVQWWAVSRDSCTIAVSQHVQDSAGGWKFRVFLLRLAGYTAQQAVA
ncbi:hypothetical protein WJX73_009669 [Symbiochloris irregularis]|uniref:Uncharacterized protein n=1 Tax=Symbiochloris irregularis TaxID=706552 RepID=A0AAW1NS31_9CHLO